MNRKGFAITTVVYGLTVLGLMIIVILMGLLSSTRNNVSSEAKRIEEDLIAYNLASKNYTCTGTNYIHTVPVGESGWYRIEAYGARNGNAKGAYTTGIIYLPEGLELNICNSTNPEISYNGNVIMRPAETSSDGSGTLKKYHGESKGPEIDQFTFRLKDSSNLIGSNGVSYDTSTASIIHGYPAGIDQTPIPATVGGKNVNLYFVDGFMLPNVNEGEPRIYLTKLADDDIEKYETGNITHNENIPGRNPKYNEVISVKVEMKSSTVSLDAISVSYQGNVKNKSCTGTECEFNLGSKVNIDDISILFTPSSYNQEIGGDSNNSFVKISLQLFDGRIADIYTSEGLIGTNGEKQTVVTPTGIKMSAYQPDWLENDLPPHGNYYIFPVSTESKVWSARESIEADANPIVAEYLTGAARQKWSIDIISTANEKDDRQVTDPNDSTKMISVCKSENNTAYKLFDNILNNSCATEYRIMELTRFKSITIYKDENIRRNAIAAPETFQSLSRNDPQIWNIRTMNDGTFAIKTVVPSSNPQLKAGFLAADTNAAGTEEDPIRIMIGTAYNSGTTVEDKETNPTAVERVRLYAIDFVR